jgi:hypothetical protein
MLYKPEVRRRTITALATQRNLAITAFSSKSCCSGLRMRAEGKRITSKNPSPPTPITAAVT